MTTSELLDEWLNNHQRDRIKITTYDRYRHLIDLHMNPVLGDCDIQAMTRRQVYDFLMMERRSGNRREGGALSPASVNMMLSILRMAFEYACDVELLEVNPCDRVKRIPDPEGYRADAFTREEQQRLERAIDTKGDVRLFGILLSLYTGLRIGELLGLEWTDLDQACTMLTVNRTVHRGKGGEGAWHLYTEQPKTQSSCRQIPLPPHISRMLREIRYTSISPYVICNKKGGRMPTRSYQYIFERLTEETGVRKLNFHTLRHTFATRALENGMDIKTLSELLGHKNASITLNRYAHSMMETKIIMMRRMTGLV